MGGVGRNCEIEDLAGDCFETAYLSPSAVPTKDQKYLILSIERLGLFDPPTSRRAGFPSRELVKRAPVERAGKEGWGFCILTEAL